MAALYRSNDFLEVLGSEVVPGSPLLLKGILAIQLRADESLTHATINRHRCMWHLSSGCKNYLHSPPLPSSSSSNCSIRHENCSMQHESPTKLQCMSEYFVAVLRVLLPRSGRLASCSLEQTLVVLSAPGDCCSPPP